MTEPTAFVIFAAAGTLAVLAAAVALLRAWQGWLELRRLEIDRRQGARAAPRRIEMADLRDRVRRLEAIADGADR